jgi:hypothetical protein
MLVDQGQSLRIGVDLCVVKQALGLPQSADCTTPVAVDARVAPSIKRPL